MSGFFSSKERDFEELVYRGVESDELDYKTHMSWNSMPRSAKGKLLRHLVAFANTRGGYLVIGVGEDQFGNPNLYTGVSAEEAGSFDPSAVGNFLNSYVEPAIDFTIERPIIRGKRYVIFVIKPFKTLPHVCTHTIEGEIQSGVFYIRTVEASSRPARRALEMQDLIRRAMRNERETLGRVLRGILYENGSIPSGDSHIRCADAIEESEHYFRRRTSSFDLPQIKFTVEPSHFSPGEFSIEQLKKTVFQSLRPDIRFLQKSETEALPTPGSLRYISTKTKRMWQFFDTGIFCFFAVISEEKVNFDDIVKLSAAAVEFCSKLYTALNWHEELLTLRLEIINPAAVKLIDCGQDFTFDANGNCRSEIIRSAADLASGKESHAARLACKIGEQYHICGSKLERLLEVVTNCLESK